MTQTNAAQRRSQDLSGFVKLVDEKGLPEVLRGIAELCNRRAFLAGRGFPQEHNEAMLNLASATLGDLANDLEASNSQVKP